MNRPRILLTGRYGQVGWELERILPQVGEVFAFGKEDLDLAYPDQIREKVRLVKPSIIVNAAAYTAVDKAEKEPELAMAVNGTAPGVLAEEAKRADALLVHYSTDYVFDGTKTTAYTEEDEPNPLNVYGKTKLAGEQAIRSTCPRHLIFRTSWVYGLRGRNFLLTILRLAKEKEELRVVNDQRGAPTWCRRIALATAEILNRPAILNLDNDCFFGLYNLVAGGSCTWFEFAQGILAASGEKALENTRVIPIRTEDYPTPVKRPPDSRLDCAKAIKAFGIELPDWKDDLHLAAKGDSPAGDLRHNGK